MANEENLKNGKQTQFRTGEEQAKNAQKGGIASGKARRRKKLLRETVEMLVKLPLYEGQLDKLTSIENIKSGKAAQGEQPTNMTVEEAMILKQINRAMKGDLNALKFILSLYSQQQEKPIDRTTEANTDSTFIDALNGKAAEAWNDGDTEAE